MFIADIVSVAVDPSLIDEKGALRLERAGLAAYAHGDYFALGKKIGDFGFSVRKKRPQKNGRTKKDTIPAKDVNFKKNPAPAEKQNKIKKPARQTIPRGIFHITSTTVRTPSETTNFISTSENLIP